MYNTAQSLLKIGNWFKIFRIFGFSNEIIAQKKNRLKFTI